MTYKMNFPLDKIDIAIYHKPCFDGNSCALIIYHNYIKHKFKLPKFYGVAPGEKELNINEYKKKNVIIMDVAFNKEQILLLKKECNNLLIVDHHVSNYNILKDLDFCIFDLNKSASHILYELFYPQQKLPLFLEKIEDNDILKTPPNYDDSPHFFTALQVKFQNNMDLGSNNWEQWLKLFDNDYIQELTMIGKNYYEYKEFIINNNNKYYKKVIILSNPKLNVFCFSNTHIVGLSSDLLHSIEDKCDIAMLYKYIENKKTYLVTMRTNKNIDLVELFGDKLSGHTKAVSGFIKDIKTFIK
jgi:nanoRNase/pAp phosphatase (c-di-AMP/oligoRNAs hydrolase)